MQIIQKFREMLPGMVTAELDNILASLRAYWMVEHNEDGTHSHITAESLIVNGVPITGTGGGGSGTPGGATSTVQYNASGAFGGDGAFTFDESTKVVTIIGQYYSVARDDGTSGSAKTINFNNGNEHSITLTAHCTLTFDNPVDGGRYTLMLTQDVTGGRTVTWPSTVRWNGGLAPTLTATPMRTDLIVFMYLSKDERYVGAYNLNYDLV